MASKWVIFFYVFVARAALASCPPESFPIEYDSPITGSKKITCGYYRENVLVKHGPESELDSSGKVKKINYYNHGEVGEVPAAGPSKAEVSLENLELNEAIQTITKLFWFLTFYQSGDLGEVFKVGKCDNNPRAWVMAAALKKTLKRTYTFKEHCDISGSFTASFQDQFPVSFQLRNLLEYTKTEMMVLMSVKMNSGALRFRYEVTGGHLISEKKKFEFNAEYEIDLDPESGKTKFDTQSGTVTITRFNDKQMNFKRPVQFRP